MTRGVTLVVALTVLGGLWHSPATGWPALSGPYFGQKPPGTRAEMFAPGIVSSEYHEDGPPVFSADGRDCFWRVCGSRNGISIPGVVYWSREEDGRWSEPRLASFTCPHGTARLCLQPDGRRMYFASRRFGPLDRQEEEWQPWFVDRTPSGWSEPHPLAPPISNRRLTSFSMSTDGSLLCVLEDPGAKSAGTAVYRIRRTGDGFAAPEPMGVVPTDTTQLVAAPAFSPDGSTCVFTTRGDSGLALMVSFRRKDGAWTAPLALGNDVNAPRQTKFPGFSPDGRYLFFVTDRSCPRRNPPGLWKNHAFDGPHWAPPCDVYWVDAKAIEALRPKKP